MQKIKKGFTMVELSFAMVFLSILSLVIIMVIMDAVSSYRRGLTLNQINTVGMDLVDDMRTAIQASPARSLLKDCTELFDDSTVCKNDSGKSLVMMQEVGKIKNMNDGTEMSNIPLYGIFCTGKYSYIWHSGYLFDENIEIESPNDAGEGLALEYKILMDGMTQAETKTIGDKPRLLKIQDEERMVCKKAAGYNDTSTTSGTYQTEFSGKTIDISNVTLDEEPVDLLKSDDFSDLALYDLTSSVPAKAEGVNSAFYSVSFMLGTLKGGADISVSGNNCKPPEDDFSEFDYCAINKFNFAAQAIGG